MQIKKPYDLIVITGPTASGKTSLAARLAYDIDGEIISADSRQVYSKMDIGTGKDLEDYIVFGKKINYHLIDIAEPGYKYNVFEFQKDFVKAYTDTRNNGKFPILCGGTGLYIEAALGKYKLIEVPENPKLRDELNGKPMNELISMLQSLKTLHNTSDTTDKERLIRALEIEFFNKQNPDFKSSMPNINYIIFAANPPRYIIRQKITNRLKQRLESGMIEEVDALLKSGLSPEQLIYYGLEYKYITNYIIGKLSYEEMFNLLNTAIHQFAKRQMTWFRRMQKNGFEINWIDSYKDIIDRVM
jgi:tRNA dimethylallyltransferase